MRSGTTLQSKNRVKKLKVATKLAVQFADPRLAPFSKRFNAEDGTKRHDCRGIRSCVQQSQAPSCLSGVDKNIERCTGTNGKRATVVVVFGTIMRLHGNLSF